MAAQGQGTNQDIFSTHPGTLAGRYLRHFWQPLIRSADLVTEHPRPVRLLGEDLAAYRGSSGKARVVQGYSPHRAAQLSVG